MASMTTTDRHELWHFPPLFTIQKHVDVKARQLDVWQTIVLNHHRQQKTSVLDIASAPYFTNETIGRSLNRSEIKQVLDYLVSTDHGEWMDETQTQFLVLWDTAQELANAIYRWAQDTGKIGDVYTVYDIYAEDDSANESFHGLHARCIVKALTRLQEGQRAKISRAEGKPLDEWGVLFVDDQ
jgi:hypothetical protein